MTDTARAKGALLALLPDNSSGLIEPQDVRDWVVSLPHLVTRAANYNFAALPASLAPSSALSAGVTNTITFTAANPCPWGVAGADTNHWLYVSGGTGGAEAVLITGGTATGGSTSGTLTFVPANNHSGAWTIISATAGVMETALATAGALVELPNGTSNFYKKVTLPASCAGVIGDGFGQSVIGGNFTAASVFELATSGMVCRFENFEYIPLSGNMTAGAVIDATASASLTCRNLLLGTDGAGFSVYIGIRTAATSPGNRVYVNDTKIIAEFRGLHIDTAYLSINNVQVFSGRDASNYIANGAALYLKAIAGANIVSFIHDGGVFAYGWLVDIASTSVNELMVSNLYLDNWIVAGIGVTGTGAAAAWQFSSFRIVDNNGTLATSVVGFGLSVTAGCIGWEFGNGVILYAYGYGVQVSGSATDIHFGNVEISPNLTNAGNAAVVVNGGTPKRLQFNGGALGLGADDGTASTTYGFVSSRAIDGLVINGVTIGGSTQANKIVLAGTETNVRISGNNGIGNVAKSVAAAATLTFPVMEDIDCIEITGATALATAVAGLREGQKITMVWTNGSPGAVSQVATIASPGFTPTRYVAYGSMFTGGKLYLSVPLP